MSSSGTSSHRRARRVVATFEHYADAERAVDLLADRNFPVQQVAIVGHDLRMVEQVIGKMGYGRAALSGAGSGALIGLLFGAIAWAVSWIEPLVAGLLLALYGLGLGAIVGALLAMTFYAMQGGRRDFASVRMMLPTSYQVVADEEVADDAVRLLAGQSEG